MDGADADSNTSPGRIVAVIEAPPGVSVEDGRRDLVPVMTDLLRDAEFGRGIRRQLTAAAPAITQPGADRLLIAIQMLEGLIQLAAADATCQLPRTAARLASEQLSQPELKHRAREATNAANAITLGLTLVTAALAEGREGRWPALFPAQARTTGGQVDGNYACLRGHLAAVTEYGEQLKLFGSLAKVAALLAKEANRLGGVAGRSIKGKQIEQWRRQVRSTATPDDLIEKVAYRSVLKALLTQSEQPQTKPDAIKILRDQVQVCPAIDPRRIEKR